jgi:hypothetical protein
MVRMRKLRKGKGRSDTWSNPLRFARSVWIVIVSSASCRRLRFFLLFCDDHYYSYCSQFVCSTVYCTDLLRSRERLVYLLTVGQGRGCLCGLSSLVSSSLSIYLRTAKCSSGILMQSSWSWPLLIGPYACRTQTGMKY